MKSSKSHDAQFSAINRDHASRNKGSDVSMMTHEAGGSAKFSLPGPKAKSFPKNSGDIPALNRKGVQGALAVLDTLSGTLLSTTYLNANASDPAADMFSTAPLVLASAEEHPHEYMMNKSPATCTKPDRTNHTHPTHHAIHHHFHHANVDPPNAVRASLQPTSQAMMTRQRLTPTRP